MLIQQQNPRNIGFAPLFTSLTMLVFIPIAAIAITMRNLLSVLSGSNTSALTPQLTAIVVITDAPIKNNMKNGKIFFILILPAPLDFCFFALARASTSVMGVTTLSLPSMIMLRKAVKPKLLGIFIAVCTVGIIIVGYLFNALEYIII